MKFIVILRDTRTGTDHQYEVEARPTSYTPAPAKAAQAARKIARKALRCKASDLKCMLASPI